jgi:hypothetical protein
VTENVLSLARFSLAYESCKLGLMPTSNFFDNDGHQLALDPSDWQLFAYPQQDTGPPRIWIPIQKLSNCGKGKFLADDPISDTGSRACPPSPCDEISFIKDSHSVVPPARGPLQPISTNVRSSYVMKAKENKRLAVNCIEVDDPVRTKNKKKPAHVPKKYRNLPW